MLMVLYMPLHRKMWQRQKEQRLRSVVKRPPGPRSDGTTTALTVNFLWFCTTVTLSSVRAFQSTQLSAGTNLPSPMWALMLPAFTHVMKSKNFPGTSHFSWKLKVFMWHTGNSYYSFWDIALHGTFINFMFYCIFCIMVFTSQKPMLPQKGCSQQQAKEKHPQQRAQVRLFLLQRCSYQQSWPTSIQVTNRMGDCCWLVKFCYLANHIPTLASLSALY